MYSILYYFHCGIIEEVSTLLLLFSKFMEIYSHLVIYIKIIIFSLLIWQKIKNKLLAQIDFLVPIGEIIKRILNVRQDSSNWYLACIMAIITRCITSFTLNVKQVSRSTFVEQALSMNGSLLSRCQVIQLQTEYLLLVTFICFFFISFVSFDQNITLYQVIERTEIITR